MRGSHTHSLSVLSCEQVPAHPRYLSASWASRDVPGGPSGSPGTRRVARDLWSLIMVAVLRGSLPPTTANSELSKSQPRDTTISIACQVVAAQPCRACASTAARSRRFALLNGRGGSSWWSAAPVDSAVSGFRQTGPPPRSPRAMTVDSRKTKGRSSGNAVPGASGVQLLIASMVSPIRVLLRDFRCSVSMACEHSTRNLRPIMGCNAWRRPVMYVCLGWKNLRFASGSCPGSGRERVIYLGGMRQNPGSRQVGVTPANEDAV